MMTLKIKFDSSWTNSMFDGPGGSPLFTSGKQFGDSMRGLVAADPALLQADTRIPYLQGLQKLNPGMAYRVPESYDRAVQGVLSRLVGEVRRLDAVEKDHLALRAFLAGSYEMNIDEENSQTNLLATYQTNQVASGGVGVISKDALYCGSAEAREIFGFLGLSLAEMQEQVDEISTFQGDHPRYRWTPKSPADLISRLGALDEEQKQTIKSEKGATAEGSEYVSPYANLCQFFEVAFKGDVETTVAKRIAAAAAVAASSAGKKLSKSSAIPTTVASGALEGWSLAGALVVTRIRQLQPAMVADLVAAGGLSRNGGLGGMSMTGEIGGVTAKDMYGFASGQKAESNSMPYRCTVPVTFKASPDIAGSGLAKDRTSYIASGVIKKTGSMTFKISGDAVLEQEIFEAIRKACVGPFHFGKKGVAHIEKLTWT